MGTTPESTPGRIIIDPAVNALVVHYAMDQEYLVTTVDKVRLCLNDALKDMEQARAWAAPAGVLVTLVATLLTSSFRDWLLPASTWQALFIFFGIASVCWLIRTLWRIRRTPTVDHIIEQMKKGTVAQKSPRRLGS